MDQFINQAVNIDYPNNWERRTALCNLYPGLDDVYYYRNPSFFLSTEPVVQDLYKPAIRHCRPQKKGGYFDYIVKKQFNTLREWAIDAGGCLELVVWGVNRQGSRFTAPIAEFLGKLGYVAPMETESPSFDDELSTFLEKMNISKIGLLKQIVASLD
jgi:hypothetical protein